MSAKAQPKITPLADLKKKREIVALTPAGNYFKIRPINLERHALSGGLPARLRAAAMKGQDGVNELLSTGDDDRLSSEGEGVREYLDLLVAETIVEPCLFLTDADGNVLRGSVEDGEVRQDPSGPKLVDPEAIEAIPPVDYKWALGIAFQEIDRDGEDKLLWGREPLSRWTTFRVFHNCPEDCEGCSHLLSELSAAS